MFTFSKDTTGATILAGIDRPEETIDAIAKVDNVQSPKFIHRILTDFKSTDAGTHPERWSNTSPWEMLLNISEKFHRQVEAVDEDLNDESKRNSLNEISKNLIDAMSKIGEMKLDRNDKEAINAMKAIVCTIQGLYTRAVRKDSSNKLWTTDLMYRQTGLTRIGGLSGIYEAADQWIKKIKEDKFSDSLNKKKGALENDIKKIKGTWPEEKAREIATELLRDKPKVSSTGLLSKRLIDPLDEMLNKINKNSEDEIPYDPEIARRLKLNDKQIEAWEALTERAADMRLESSLLGPEDTALQVVGVVKSWGGRGLEFLGVAKSEETELKEKFKKMNMILSVAIDQTKKREAAEKEQYAYFSMTTIIKQLRGILKEYVDNLKLKDKDKKIDPRMIEVNSVYNFLDNNLKEKKMNSSEFLEGMYRQIVIFKGELDKKDEKTLKKIDQLLKVIQSALPEKEIQTSAEVSSERSMSENRSEVSVSDRADRKYTGP